MAEEARLDFPGLKAHLLGQAHSLLPLWLPGGKVRGRRYFCGDITGGPGESLSVDLDKGCWADFATGQAGGDLIDLYGTIHNISSSADAYRAVAAEARYGPSDSQRRQPNGHKAKERQDKERPVVGLPPPDTQPPDCRHHDHGLPSQKWEYKGLSNETLFWVARYDTPEGKQILPWSWSLQRQRWVLKGWTPPRPLYGLHGLPVNPAAPILIVEGEKAADAAAEIVGDRYAVVTWPNGSNAVRKVDWTPITGRHVMIWPDADKPGREAAAEIASILLPSVANVKILDTEGQPSGWDAADAVAAGWTWDTLFEWAKPRAKTIEKPVPKPVAKVKPQRLVAAAPGSSIMVQVNQLTISPEELHAQPTESEHALWEKMGLQRNASGRPIPNVDNVVRVLSHVTDFRDVLWRDRFSGRVRTRWMSAQERDWTDEDDLRLTVNLQRDMRILNVGDETVSKAVQVFANLNERNEPVEWLKSLVWDGNERLEGFLSAYFGVALSKYVINVSKNFWVSLVARILRPGCQVDNMMILEGKQGVGKTSALRIIGGPWYTNIHDSILSKDFFQALQGKFLIEIDELESFRGQQMTRIKSIITTTVDHYRPPYGRRTQEHPRSCVFVGTTNENEYLTDDTGHRRFWPVLCQGTIKLDEISKNREQLFAEAVARLKEGTAWYKMPEADAADEQGKRAIGDEWMGAVDEYMRTHAVVTVREIWTEAINGMLSGLGRGESMRIAAVLRRLGYVRYDGRVDGIKGKYWARPGTQIR